MQMRDSLHQLHFDGLQGLLVDLPIAKEFDLRLHHAGGVLRDRRGHTGVLHPSDAATGGKYGGHLLGSACSDGHLAGNHHWGTG